MRTVTFAWLCWNLLTTAAPMFEVTPRCGVITFIIAVLAFWIYAELQDYFKGAKWRWFH